MAMVTDSGVATVQFGGMPRAFPSISSDKNNAKPRL